MYGYNPLAIEQLHQARITELRNDATAARRARIGRRSWRSRHQGRLAS
jgi:hypothetical protein